MAESADKAAKSAEQAYAEATAAAPAKSETAEAGAPPTAVDQRAKVEASAEPAVKAAKKIAKPVRKKPGAKVRRTFSRPKRVTATSAAPAPTVTELKEKIMANAKTTDYSQPFTEAVSEFQSKAKAAYEKGAQLAAEANAFVKGNVEAVVESGKVYTSGVQDLSKGYVEEAKSAYETLTADLKEFAAVKSPAELFQLQGKLARRNFDALVAYTSKNTDTVTKLASEAFAPISGRLSLAAEKISTAA